MYDQLKLKPMHLQPWVSNTLVAHQLTRLDRNILIDQEGATVSVKVTGKRYRVFICSMPISCHDLLMMLKQSIVEFEGNNCICFFYTHNYNMKKCLFSMSFINMLGGISLYQTWLLPLKLSEVGLLQELETLDVSMNQLRSLPHQLSSCASLQTLTVDHNLLRHIPRQLCWLRHLNQISMAANQLSFLPLGQCITLSMWCFCRSPEESSVILCVHVCVFQI